MMKRNPDWQSEFLGRCAFCLDNASLDGPPCFDRFTGQKVGEADCLILKVRKADLQKSKGKV